MVKPPENSSQKVTEDIKYFIWALGIGVAVTLTVLTYAHANFPTKEIFLLQKESRNKEISTIVESVKEIKKENKEFQDWLRDNWSKRHPGGN